MARAEHDRGPYGGHRDPDLEAGVYAACTLIVLGVLGWVYVLPWAAGWVA